MTSLPVHDVSSPVSSRAVRMFAAFRHRNYRLFFAGQSISLIGTWMQSTAQGWLVYELTGSKFLLGLVAALGSLPLLIFAIPGGAVADRVPKRMVLVATQSSAMLLALAMAILVGTDVVRVWHIATIAALNGLVMAFDIPTRQSFVVEMTNKEDLTNAIALNSTMFNGARIVGPAVAGIVIAEMGMAWCFLLNGISFIAVIISLLLMRLPPQATRVMRESPSSHALAAFRHLRENRRVLLTLMLVSIVGIFGWSYSVLMPAFARDALDVPVNGYGMLLSASGFGAMMGALLVAALGNSGNKRLQMIGGVWLFSVMIISFSLTDVFPLALVFLAGAGLGILTCFSTANSVVQLGVPDEMRGRVMGVWTLVFGGMTPVGSFLAGLLAHAFGAPHAVQIGATVCAVAAGAALWCTRENGMTTKTATNLQ